MGSTVAVIIRTKDRPLLLRRALASVLAQTHVDLSIVVVNDGGDRELLDATTSEVVGTDSRLRVVHHEVSQGRSAAFNAGLASTDAPYVAVHDDDDTWDPRFLEATVAHLESDPGAGAVATRTWLVREHLRDGAITEDSRELFATSIEVATLVEMVWANFIPPISMLMRHAAVDDVGPFDTSLPVLEDWDFNLRLLSRYRVGFLPDEPLASWHHRDSAGLDGNSVVTEAANHARFDLRIRDEYLRGERVALDGLGSLLATTYHLRRMSTASDQARATQSEIADRWHTSHTDHLDAATATVRVEVGRVRGDVLGLGERLHHLDNRLTSVVDGVSVAVRQGTKPLRQRVNQLTRQSERVARDVADLAAVSKPVDRLRRRRDG